ncbi:MAG: PEP-CTERM sorting domain-containing protein [Verrucomicrobia bacterium]|nr:PEP-CTERM sorting domain-containing protein [Verrucomicrobiota bacterium]
MNDTSTGSMFINHNVPDGGTFSSSFVVRPTLTFTRHGDLAERETTRIDNLTTGGVQWSYDAPHNAVTVPETSNFFPGGTPGDTFGTVQQFRYQGGQFTWDLHLTVPEPSTDLLMMAGVAAFLLVTRRFK